MGDHSELKRLLTAQVSLHQVAMKTETIEDENAYLDADDALNDHLTEVGVDLKDFALALIAESERLEGCEDVLRQLASYVGSGGYNAPEVDPEVFARKIMDGINILNDPLAQLVIKKGEQIDQLKAEIAGLKTGYEAYEQVNAGLKAEVEKLRDDLEQNQYDANAWRNGEESVWIEVFNSDGDDPFISAISGQITVEQLALIQAEILEYRDDYFEKGSGLYVFRCAHYQAHYDNVGMTEPAHWETDFESYSAFPWEEESATLTQGEQS